MSFEDRLAGELHRIGVNLDRQQREPVSVRELAGNAGLRAAEGFLAERGLQLERMLVILQVGGIDAGADDCTICGHGYDDAAELLAGALGHLASMAKALGLELQVLTPIPDGPGPRSAGGAASCPDRSS